MAADEESIGGNQVSGLEVADIADEEVIDGDLERSTAPDDLDGAIFFLQHQRQEPSALGWGKEDGWVTFLFNFTN